MLLENIDLSKYFLHADNIPLFYLNLAISLS
jgi:hypothetical protein